MYCILISYRPLAVRLWPFTCNLTEGEFVSGRWYEWEYTIWVLGSVAPKMFIHTSVAECIDRLFLYIYEEFTYVHGGIRAHGEGGRAALTRPHHGQDINWTFTPVLAAQTRKSGWSGEEYPAPAKWDTEHMVAHSKIAKIKNKRKSASKWLQHSAEVGLNTSLTSLSPLVS